MMKNYQHYQGKRRGKKLLTVLLAIILAGVAFFGLLLGVVLSGGHDRVEGEPGVMIVLGCQVKPWGPSILLQDRLDKARSYLSEYPETTVVVSGGQGADEPVSEARAMYDYLVENGIPGGQILLEEQSTNTVENLRLSLALLEEGEYDLTGGVAVVSNGFHLARVRMLWGRVCDGEVPLSTLAAPSSHTPSRLKMYVREPLALVKSFLFDR